MQPHHFSLLPLLLLAGFLAADSISPNETRLKQAKGATIKKENNVLLLEKSSFERALQESKYLLVEFCEYQSHCLLA